YAKERLPRREPLPCETSAAQAEALDQRAVALDVGVLEVAQEALATTDEQQQTTTAVVVVLVLPRVLGEVLDALGQHRDLHLGRTGVTLDGGVLLHDLLLHSSVQPHGRLLLFVARRTWACPPGLSGSAAGLTAGINLPAQRGPARIAAPGVDPSRPACRGPSGCDTLRV